MICLHSFAFKDISTGLPSWEGGVLPMGQTAWIPAGGYSSIINSSIIMVGPCSSAGYVAHSLFHIMVTQTNHSLVFSNTWWQECVVYVGFPAVQFISIPDERYDEYRRSSDFIKEYIFPGGCLPSLSRLTSAMASSSRLW